MKIKHRLAIFNAVTRFAVVLILWWLLPILIERVVYKHINESLTYKKESFIKRLDKEEINDYIIKKDSSETFASFTTLHDEFLQLSRLPMAQVTENTKFITEPRIIEGEQNDYRILEHRFTYDHQAYLLEIGSSLSEIKDLTIAIRVFFLVVLFVTISVTFAVDTLYIEYLLKPFYRIIDTKIRKVDQPETFDHTPIHSVSADFRALDEGLNQMMTRISDLFAKEKQFIANVSHELLTPIALLKNKFENLLQNDSLDDEAIDKIAASLKTLDRLKKIISNLLLISRIDNHQYQLNEEVNCTEVVATLTEELEDRIQMRGLSLRNELQYSYKFKGNQVLFQILLYNLLVNAIKYNRENGSIVLSDQMTQDEYMLQIIDTGIGMTQEEIAHVFKRFSRQNKDREGYGLGLAIVESIAHFHHITLKVASEPNKGTIFTLIFKLNG
jgi:signal transduction histidine kinase